MPIIVWLITCLYSFFQFFMQVSGNLLIINWMQDFHAAEAGASFVSSAFFYSYVLMQIPAGMLFDRFGIKRVLRIASLVFLLGIVLLYLSPTLTFAIIARFIMGAGAGVAFVSMVYVSSIWFPTKRFAMMVGLGEMIAMLGVAILEVLAPHLILAFGWRKVMLALAILAVVQCLLIFRYLQDPPKSLIKTSHIISKKPFWQALISGFAKVGKNRNIWCAGCICCGTFGVVSIFAALWGNNFIQVVYQESYVHAALFLSLLLIGVAVIGALNERHVPYKPLIFISLSALLISTLLVLSGVLNLPLLLIFIFFMGFFGSSYVISFFVTQESTSIETRGAGIGLCNAIALLGGMVFQPITGLVLQISSSHFTSVIAFKLAMLILPIVIIAGILLAFLIKLPKHH
jgi:MFS family permease